MRPGDMHIQSSFMLNLYFRLNYDFSIIIGSKVIFLAWISILDTILSYLHDYIDVRICQEIYQLKCSDTYWNRIKLCPVKQRNCCETKSDVQRFLWISHQVWYLSHTGAGGVRAGPHCGIRMRETVHTGAGLGAESREHFFGLFIRFLISTRTKWAKDSWPSQDKAFTSNLIQTQLSLYVRNFKY